MSKSITKKIANEVGDVYEDVTHSLSKMIKHLTAEAGDQLSAKGVALVHAANELIEEARAEGGKIAAKAGKEAREHPATTTAIAAAAVALLGVALSRRIQDAG